MATVTPGTWASASEIHSRSAASHGKLRRDEADPVEAERTFPVITVGTLSPELRLQATQTSATMSADAACLAVAAPRQPPRLGLEAITVALIPEGAASLKLRGARRDGDFLIDSGGAGRYRDRIGMREGHASPSTFARGTGVILGVLAGGGLLFACTSGETLEVSPNTAALSIPAGSSDTVGIQVLLPNSSLHSVTLPINVHVAGDASDLGSGIGVSSVPETISLAERGSAQDATLTISVARGTVPGAHLAVVRPSASKLDSGQGIRISVSVPDDPPVVTIDSPQDGAEVGGATVAITGIIDDPNDNVALWQILLDDGVVASGSQGDPVSVNADAAGFADQSEHKVEITAEDEGGNTDSKTATFTYHQNAPTAAIDSPKNGDFVCETFDVTGSIADPDGNVTVWTLSLDGTEFDSETLAGPGASPVAVSSKFDTVASGTGDGSHVILLEGVDDTGLTGSASVSVALVNTPPVTITKPASGTLYVNDSAIASPGGTTTVVGSITATADVAGRMIGDDGTCRTVDASGLCFRLNDGACADSSSVTLTPGTGKITAQHTYSSSELQGSDNVVTVDVVDNGGNGGSATSAPFNRSP